MQTAYDRFEMKVHKGSGSLLVVIPHRICERLNIKTGDYVVSDDPKERHNYRFYKKPRSNLQCRPTTPTATVRNAVAQQQ